MFLLEKLVSIVDRKSHIALASRVYMYHNNTLQQHDEAATIGRKFCNNNPLPQPRISADLVKIAIVDANNCDRCVLKSVASFLCV